MQSWENQKAELPILINPSSDTSSERSMFGSITNVCIWSSTKNAPRGKEGALSQTINTDSSPTRNCASLGEASAYLRSLGRQGDAPLGCLSPETASLSAKLPDRSWIWEMSAAGSASDLLMHDLRVMQCTRETEINIFTPQGLKSIYRLWLCNPIFLKYLIFSCNRYLRTRIRGLGNIILSLFPTLITKPNDKHATIKIALSPSEIPGMFRQLTDII